MILEFLPAGDLCKFLHPEPGVSIAREKFPWPLRIRMALDIAKGMQYLQSREPPVVHRDLRSPNIFVCIPSDVNRCDGVDESKWLED
jgi:serine/threonine protein kinase